MGRPHPKCIWCHCPPKEYYTKARADKDEVEYKKACCAKAVTTSVNEVAFEELKVPQKRYLTQQAIAIIGLLFSDSHYHSKGKLKLFFLMPFIIICLWT